MKFSCRVLALSVAASLAAESAILKPFNTELATNGPMPVPELIAQSKLPPGFKLSVFAAEPDVQQPIGMATDARGRVWVAENYTYSERTVGYHKDLRDRIVVFEDTDMSTAPPAKKKVTTHEIHAPRGVCRRQPPFSENDEARQTLAKDIMKPRENYLQKLVALGCQPALWVGTPRAVPADDV